ncbi:unnamed protein product, partial [Ixodes pacificus]
YLSVYRGLTLSVSNRAKRRRTPAPIAIILPRGSHFHRSSVPCIKSQLF